MRRYGGQFGFLVDDDELIWRCSEEAKVENGTRGG